jgi:hypothetical protein
MNKTTLAAFCGILLAITTTAAQEVTAAVKVLE